MQLITATVTNNRPLTTEAFVLSLAVPERVWAGVKAGQFFHLRCGDGADPLLRRPISLHRINRETGEVSMMIRPTGRGTAWLSQRREGDLIDMLGPLGRGFRIDPKARNLLLVAGGIGIAPLVAVADEAVRRGLSVLMVAGAASKDRLFPGPALPPEVEYRTATDDGSAGHHGFVTDLLTDAAHWADQILACGPQPMFLALASMKRQGRLGGVHVQVSLERRMACGVGACLGCVVASNGGFRRVCADGPVFNLEDVSW